MYSCSGQTNPKFSRYFNPSRNPTYFSNTNADPYTYLGYWRRRFATDQSYMSYNYQYPDKCHNFRAPGYMNTGGLNIGWSCPVMGTSQTCNPYKEGGSGLRSGCSQ